MTSRTPFKEQQVAIPYEWLYPASLEEAAVLQRELAQRVIREDALGPVRHLAGVDVSNNLYDPENWIYASTVTLTAETLRIVDTANARQQSNLPYRPGFLGFREVPALVEAYRQLHQKPDLILVDGHGVSHPRGLGIASHLGVLLDCPTIGVAKSILVGQPEGVLGDSVGSSVPLVWRGRQIGVVLRTRRNVSPVYVSIGHRISLGTAIYWVMRCLTGYRLPEPTRQAHLHANSCRRELMQTDVQPARLF